jgi:hypothetical protein
MAAAAATAAPRPTPQNLSNTNIEELKKQGNVKFLNDAPLRPDLVADPAVIADFVATYRPKYEALNEENPSWNNPATPFGVLKYMYEQDAYFAIVHDKWPLLVREVCSDTCDLAQIQLILKMREKESRQEISKVSALQAIKHHNTDYVESPQAVARDAMVDLINTKYAGQPQKFCSEVNRRREAKLKKLKRRQHGL